MKVEDVLSPSYREHGIMFLRGVTMAEVLLFWGGDERGSDYAVPKQDLPVSIPIATHLAHAVGLAKAFKLRGEKRVAVTVCGDGGTSKGDFYEAMNFAGIWQLPVVFVVSNNEWAISVPRTLQTAAQTIAQKSIAAGVEGLQVDGNDVIAVTNAVARALEKARNGAGPTLIETLTYRVGDHTTADDARRYRSQEEVEKAKQTDPISRLKVFLTNEGVWSEEKEAELLRRCTTDLEQAVKRYLDTPAQAPTSMFDYLYAEMPKAYQEQYEAVQARSALCQKSH
jgi:pyruvate dehydrogenase E1 component alpha subunit